MERLRFVLICAMGLVFAENTSTDESSRIVNTDNSLEVDTVSQVTAGWGEWSSWSKWSPCSRTCGGGIIRQQRKCRRLPCRGRSVRYKLCNSQPCQQRGAEPRAEQCASFDGIPYGGELLKWTPYHDPDRPCSLICRGEPNAVAENVADIGMSTERLVDDTLETVIVQLADRVADGTKCYPKGDDVCVNGECMKVGCDLRIGSNKKRDACGVCGGDGSTCKEDYHWSLVPISACSKPCGGGFRMAMAVCKERVSGEEATDSRCESLEKPDKSTMPCNDHDCPTKWTSGQWSECSASCGGGTRTRPVFCSEENNETSTRIPDHKCVGAHKPRHQETCNTVSCPMWETNEWSECSASCGAGIRTRTVVCKDGKGRVSKDCDVVEKPHGEQECRSSVCPTPSQDGVGDSRQRYPAPPVPEKLIGQPIPSESTFIADEWSPCSVTCGEGTRRREVHCKIFLEFSRTIAKLPDRQCSGPKPIEVEKCSTEPCGFLENSLSYGMDAVGDSGYAEPSLTDTYRSAAGGSSATSYESSVRVAAGSATHTSYSWKENGYTHCSASCLGGVQELIITCVRDSDGRVVTPYLCTPETRPESRIRTCNDHPCPPRWNFSDFAPCMSPCGLGIQTRDVTCIHEVARGGTNTVHVPNNMCPQPPPPDRRYCNILDCPVKWNVGEWGKCSKTCGGGVKKRYVMCEQIMAQGHQQPRAESDCPTHKPSTQKPCNTRPCYDLEPGAQPVIYGQNTTYSQPDPNKKVDLTIGGSAIVFQGTSVVKIRCPVKKFDKAHIVWTKDRIELRKSKKYKINKKGALRIVDITYSDKGVYACIAGPSQAEVHLLVKVRPGEYMSSEEILRHGKTVHHQDPSLDSASVMSGEILRTDHAAPAYGSPFSFNGEDFSHEAHPEGSVTLRPTKKPKRKKQKPSPMPPDATMVHGEYTVTSLHQPGYQESVESTATSAATRIVPTLSRFISDLKAYWPFQVESIGSRGHRMAPNLAEGEDSPTTRTLGDRRLFGDFVDDLETDFGILRGNTGIPDEKFGPDEERIIIDDDPYDLDEAIFALQNEEDPRSDKRMTTERRKPKPTKSAIDVIEESLRKAKRYEARAKNRRVEFGGSDEPVDEIVTVVKRKENESPLIPMRTDSEPTVSLAMAENRRTRMDDLETTATPRFDLDGATEAVLVESQDNSSEISTVNEAGKTLSFANLDERLNDNAVTDSSPSPGALNSSPEFEVVKGVTFRGVTLTQPPDDEFPRDEKMSDETGEDVTSGVSEESVRRPTEGVSTTDPARFSQDGAVTWELYTATSFESGNSDDRSTMQPVLVLEKGVVADLKFEWVTTEWTECSQTCGGGGFQMRGAQCTVRSARVSANSTQTALKTAVGATLCEDAGLPAPEKVRSCGSGRCPQWHAGEWTPCETSRCFTWKTAMQRRDVTCRIVEDGAGNSSTQSPVILDASRCDESARPPQRSECYNDACKGVWKVEEWSECIASCGEDGVKYRILQCVWFGTKKAAGNACRDVARPSVMKSCKGPPCLQTTEDCKDLSQFCSRVKAMNMCRVPLYQKQCCQSCR